MKKESKVISVRLSMDDYEIIKSRAVETGRSVNAIIADGSTAGNGLTRSQKQAMYFHLSVLKDLARNECNEVGNKIIKECDALWQKLK